MNLCCFAATLILSACASAPIGSAQHDLTVLKAEYISDVQAEARYSRLPLCDVMPVPHNCVSHVVKQRLITASYRASGALFTAESEQTNAAIREARKQIGAFTELTKTLPSNE